MARRRRRFKRISPERGWLTDVRTGAITTIDLGEAASNGFTGFLPLVDFSEVDNDDDGTLITHDKSNWFCIRMLFDLVFTVSPSTVSSNNTQLFEVQALLGVAQNPSWENHSDSGNPEYAGAPFEYGWYAALNRILQTGYGLVQPYSLNPTLSNSNELIIGEASPAAMWDAATPTRLHMCWDLSTRFSLFPESSLGLLFGGKFRTSEHTVGYGVSDVLYCSATYRTLWQKGRGR